MFNPWAAKIPGGGNGNPPQYSCLENSLVRGARWVIVHGSQRAGYDLVTEHGHSKENAIQRSEERTIDTHNDTGPLGSFVLETKRCIAKKARFLFMENTD